MVSLSQSTLNDFASQPLSVRRAVRSHIQELFTSGSNVSLEGKKDILDGALFDANTVDLHLPVRVGDYTDFCEHHGHRSKPELTRPQVPANTTPPTPADS